MPHRLSFALLMLGAALAACGTENVSSAVGDLTIEPSELDFGPAWIGDSISRQVEIRNDGRVPATLAVTGFQAPFDGVRALTVPAAGSAVLELSFRPTEPTASRATVVLGSPDHPAIELDLRGEGVVAAISIEPALYFGRVKVGERLALPLPVRNEAPLATPAFHYRLDGADEDAFLVTRRVTNIGPSQTEEFEITFAPTAPVLQSAKLLVAACETCEEATVALGGTGVVAQLVANPNPLDLGDVRPGASRTRLLRVENRGGYPASLQEVRVEGAGFSADGTALPVELNENGSADLSVTFAPADLGDREGVLALIDAAGAVALEVSLRGHGGGVQVVAEPEAVNLGTVPFGWSGGAALVLRNVGEPYPVDLTGATIRGAAGWSVTTPPLPAAIGGEGLSLTVAFVARAGGTQGAELVLATSDPAWPEVTVPLRAQVLDRPCEVVASPTSLRFGVVDPEWATLRDVELVNVGGEPCLVWDLALDPAGAPTFALVDPPADRELAPGAAMRVEVRFSPGPTNLEVQTTTLRYRLSSATRPEGAVPISAWAPGTRLAAVPEPVEFGRVPPGRTLRKSFTVRGSGPPFRLLAARVSAGSPSAFRLVSTPAMPVVFTTEPQEFVVEYAPEAEGNDRGEVELEFEDAERPPYVPAPIPFREPLVVRLRGSSGPCGTECDPPIAVCPAPTEGLVGEVVTLVGSGVDPNGDPLACEWSVVSAPIGSNRRPMYPSSCSTTFYPDVVGVYTIRLQVRDPLGNVGECVTTHTSVAPPDGLWVELFWDIPDDVDLHLLHPLAGDPHSTASWRTTPYDCYYLNQNPDWDQPGVTSDDPTHDRDDTSGTGPENVRVPIPSALHPYHVGVVFFRDHGTGAPVTATINAYCRGAFAVNRQTTLTTNAETVFLGSMTFDAAGACTWTDAGPPPAP